MATLQNIGKLKYRGKDGQWHPLPVVVQSSGGGVSTISGKGAPTSETQGEVNQLYRDEDTQKLYICTATDGGYTWAAVVSDTENAVTYTAQTLTEEQKTQARANIGAGTSNFSGLYNDLTDKPNIPAATVIDTTLTKSSQAADAKAAGDAIDKKLDKAQGTGNAGKILGIGADGNVTLQNKPVQALCGPSAPTTATAGVVAQEYYVIVGNAVTEMYVCTAVTNGTYTWDPVEFGAEIDDTSTEPTKVWSAEKCNQLSKEIANLQTSGLTTAQVNALDGMFKVCAFIKADISAEYNAFRTAFDIEAATITGISATYSGGSVPAGTALSDLTGIVVTATYSDGSTETVTGYTLSGEIAEGNNTITVTYQGKTATFIVTGTAVAQTYTVTNNLTNVTNSNSATTASGYYSATLSAEDGYNINVTITMGGVDITADVYTEDGTILINEVTGDIVITATAELASSPVIYQLANTPRTVNADLYEDTGLTFGSESANGYTKAWTMVAKVKNMSAGYLWCVAGQGNLSAKYENRWNGAVGNNASHLTTAICATVVRPSVTQVNPDEISVVITKEALSEKTATVYYLNYAGELQTSQCVGTYKKFFDSTYAGNMMVGGGSSADFAGIIEEFTIYEGVATVEQIKSYLGVA